MIRKYPRCFAIINILLFTWGFGPAPRNISTGETKIFPGISPSLYYDGSRLYLSYASKDSILFCFSGDNGKTFSKSSLVGILPALSVGGGRGPQVIATKDRIIIAVTDKPGNIYAYSKTKITDRWEKPVRINDVPEIAKEGFVSLASNDTEVYAVWLDLRNNKKNKVAGTISKDGGRTWAKNKIIYDSPEGTVCECCKPNVEMRNKTVVVMFRNLLRGNRDLFISKSIDGGMNFGQAQQLGEGHWKLNACPMDGGGLVINSDNRVNTVWRRDKEIFTCIEGQKEKLLAMGKHCTIAGDQNMQAFAYVNDGKVFAFQTGKTAIELGSGVYPQLEMTGNGFACAWQSDRQVHVTTLH